MSGHTPGPWAVSNGDLLRVKPKASNAVICGVHNAGRLGGKHKADALANARLIAAAPDLLEFAQAYISAWEAGTGTVYLVDKARAAIARATSPESPAR